MLFNKNLILLSCMQLWNHTSLLSFVARVNLEMYLIASLRSFNSFNDLLHCCLLGNKAVDVKLTVPPVGFSVASERNESISGLMSNVNH